jgi:hypothetical protein
MKRCNACKKVLLLLLSWNLKAPSWEALWNK